MRLTLFAGLTPRQFLSRHWQKKPLLIRQAFPGFSGPLTRATALRLARSSKLESRLIRRQGRSWLLSHGPISQSMLAALPARNWTLLLQGLNKINAEADALMHRFDFIPYARQDDVMASYAVTGGGVGPHVDSYDVFLLQGSGRRRWRIGRAEDTTCRRNVPLKILRTFRPQQEWVLEPGDMLYLPPGYAHEGVALNECFTYSIGFRAPTHQELCGEFLDYLHDTLKLEGRLQDRGLRPTTTPGELPPAMLAQAVRALHKLRWTRNTVAEFLGRKLSEPKLHVIFSRPDAALDSRSFALALRQHGIALDARSLLLYSGSRLYMNGEPVDLSVATPADLATLKQLADRRRLAVNMISSAALRALLYSWYRYGFAHIDGRIHP